jgi:hypothetical protein
MSRLTDLSRVRTVMYEAVSIALQGVQLSGIAEAAIRKVVLSTK